MNIISKAFHDLSAKELYAALRLRSAVFVVEQKCAYQDADNHDQSAQHLLMMQGDALIAYARILPPGGKYPQCSIGRIAVGAAHRGKNYGRQLMDFALAEARRLYPRSKLMVQAQTYLAPFYQSYGFQSCTDEYDEDGVMHVDMEMAA